MKLLRHIYFKLGLGLEPKRSEKKTACPARVAVAGQENIETVHGPKPIQVAITLCMDRVAVLWKVPTARIPVYLKGRAPSR